MVGARKKCRAATSHETAMVIGMMSQAVTMPDHLETDSIVSMVVRTRGDTSAWVWFRVVAVATGGLRSARGARGNGNGSDAAGPVRGPAAREMTSPAGHFSQIFSL